MAGTFTPTITGKIKTGKGFIRWGTYTGASSNTGGNIDCATPQVRFIAMQPYGSAVDTEQSVVNESLPAAVKPTVVMQADQAGLWFALVK